MKTRMAIVLLQNIIAPDKGWCKFWEHTFLDTKVQLYVYNANNYSTRHDLPEAFPLRRILEEMRKHAL